MEYGPQFANLLREVRATLNVTQEIGRAVGLGHGAWQSYEQRSKLPSIENLFKIADQLAAKFEGRPVPSQAQFLASWIQAHGIEADQAMLDALRHVGPDAVSLTGFGWLRAYAFTGERREQWARTRLDCLIGPAAVSDLRYICSLGLDRETVLIPDKELTARRWEELVRRYSDRDILSISSGAVNAMTGLLNDDMVFRFDAVPEARTAYRAFIREMSHLEQETELVAFQRCLIAADQLGASQDPVLLLREAGLAADNPRHVKVANDVSELLGGSTHSQFTSLFRQAVVDPLQCGRYQPENAFDYAVISLARHPFGGEDRLAFVIAGTNGAATSGAVQLLARGGLAGRPLGAVVRVRTSTVADADGRPSVVLVPEIITPPYQPDDVIRSIDNLLNGRGGRTLRSIFGKWSDRELTDWKDLVAGLAEVLARRRAQAG